MNAPVQGILRSPKVTYCAMSEPIDRIEQVFQRTSREAWIVTAASDAQRGGLIATWVSQAAIDRKHPAVLIGIAPNHFTAELIDASGCFALHLISAAQIELAWNFSIGSGRDRDKLSGLAFRGVETSSPILEDCLAWLDCRVFARLPTGDRNYYWADVLAGENVQAGAPLTEQQLIGLASVEQKAALRNNRELDIGTQRPLQQAWRSNLPALLRPR